MRQSHRKELTPKQQSVLSEVRSAMKDTGKFPSPTRIAQSTGIGEKTVRDALETLAARNLIRIERYVVGRSLKTKFELLEGADT